MAKFGYFCITRPFTRRAWKGPGPDLAKLDYFCIRRSFTESLEAREAQAASKESKAKSLNLEPFQDPGA